MKVEIPVRAKNLIVKAKFFNQGIQSRRDSTKEISQKEIEKGLEAFVGQAKTLDQTLKDAKNKNRTGCGK